MIQVIQVFKQGKYDSNTLACKTNTAAISENGEKLR